jgi:hypothetical protein
VGVALMVAQNCAVRLRALKCLGEALGALRQ